MVRWNAGTEYVKTQRQVRERQIPGFRPSNKRFIDSINSVTCRRASNRH
jgi:hypothetical protein